jgi:hypothetical protein
MGQPFALSPPVLTVTEPSTATPAVYRSALVFRCIMIEEGLKSWRFRHLRVVKKEAS